jgi:prepilin-type N-terminal cleavage/methylation domain-containing protein
MKRLLPPAVRDARGFSMLELVIVVVLMGLLIGLGTPRLNGFIDRSRVNSAATELVGDIAQARMLASRSGNGAVVTIHDSGYSLQQLGGAPALPVRQVNLRTNYPQMTVAHESGPALPFTLNIDSRGLIRSVTDAAGSAQAFNGSVVTIQHTTATARVRILPTGRAIHVQ